MSRPQTKEDVNAVLDAVMDRANKKYKHRVIARAQDVPNTFFLRRPSGIMQLDIDTGGGLPAGGWCFISGPDGAGKTFLLDKYFAFNQRLYGQNSRLALATTEFAPDHFLMRSRGIQVAVPDRAIEERNAWRVERGLPHFTKEEIRALKTQVGRFDIVTGATGEEILEVVLELFATKKYNIIGIDSISAILPAADADKDLSDPNARAAAASLQTKFAHQYHPLTLGLDNDVNETTLIVISQVRANNKKAEAPSHIQKYLPDFATTGAYAMKHGKLIDILVQSGGKVKEGSKEDRHQTGKILRWEITKGKAGTHDGIVGEVEYNYENLINDAETVFIAGLQMGVILDARGGLAVVRAEDKAVLNDSSGNPSSGHSRSSLLEKLASDFEFQLRTRVEILAAKNIQCRYR